MNINVRDLAAKNGRAELREQIDLASLTAKRRDIAQAEPLQVHVQAKAEAGIVEAAGTLVLPAEFVCSRCLTHYCQTLLLPFRERFTQHAHHLDEDDVQMHHVTEDKVDLLPYIEETVELGLPYVPVCEEDCKGLNPETGANLNIYPAEPAEERIDPRLEVLAQLLEKHKQQ